MCSVHPSGNATRLMPGGEGSLGLLQAAGAQAAGESSAGAWSWCAGTASDLSLSHKIFLVKYYIHTVATAGLLGKDTCFIDEMYLQATSEPDLCNLFRFALYVAFKII